MKNAIPLDITVIYFDDKSKNIYTDLPPNKEQAKRLSKRIYRRNDSRLCGASQRQGISPGLRLIVCRIGAIGLSKTVEIYFTVIRFFCLTLFGKTSKIYIL